MAASEAWTATAAARQGRGRHPGFRLRQLPDVHLRYDDDFVEAAVFTAASGRRADVPLPQIRRFHAERERCYEVPDPDERNAAFFKLHLAWFREWGLEKLLLGFVHDCPLLPQALNILAFRKARTKKDEAAELYVGAETGRNAVVAMRPERFECDEEVAHLLRREVMHLNDMVDPSFGYSPDLNVRGINPAHQRIARERYRLLWDITIDGRLGREAESARHRGLFDRAYCFWPAARRDEVFSNLWTALSPRHDDLLTLAADPRDLSHASKPVPGALCPLCGFSTFEWVDPAGIEDATLAAIRRDVPGWSAEQGICGRCAEVYSVAASVAMSAGATP